MNTHKVYAFIRSNFTNDLINYFKIENSLIIEDIKSLQQLKSKYNITNLFYTDFKNKIKNYSFKDIKIMNYNPRNRYNSYYHNNQVFGNQENIGDKITERYRWKDTKQEEIDFQKNVYHETENLQLKKYLSNSIKQLERRGKRGQFKGHKTVKHIDIKI